MFFFCADIIASGSTPGIRSCDSCLVKSFCLKNSVIFSTSKEKVLGSNIVRLLGCGSRTGRHWVSWRARGSGAAAAATPRRISAGRPVAILHQHRERGGGGAARARHVGPQLRRARLGGLGERAGAGDGSTRQRQRQIGAAAPRPRRRRRAPRSAGRRRPGPSPRPRSPRPSAPRRRAAPSAPTACISVSASASAAASAWALPTSAVMPRPIAAGVFGIARTIGVRVAERRLEGGDRGAGGDREEERRAVAERGERGRAAPIDCGLTARTATAGSGGQRAVEAEAGAGELGEARRRVRLEDGDRGGRQAAGEPALEQRRAHLAAAEQHAGRGAETSVSSMRPPPGAAGKGRRAQARP